MARYGLSAREHKVLMCVARGSSNRETGDALGISPYTVVRHLHHIFEKTGSHARAEAAMKVLGGGAREGKERE